MRAAAGRRVLVLRGGRRCVARCAWRGRWGMGYAGVRYSRCPKRVWYACNCPNRRRALSIQDIHNVGIGSERVAVGGAVGPSPVRHATSRYTNGVVVRTAFNARNAALGPPQCCFTNNQPQRRNRHGALWEQRGRGGGGEVGMGRARRPVWSITRIWTSANACPADGYVTRRRLLSVLLSRTGP